VKLVMNNILDNPMLNVDSAQQKLLLKI